MLNARAQPISSSGLCPQCRPEVSKIAENPGELQTAVCLSH